VVGHIVQVDDSSMMLRTPSTEWINKWTAADMVSTGWTLSTTLLQIPT
jgi:hypothetical protein